MIGILQKEMSKRTAMLAVFITSSVWGVLWIPLRYIEGFGLSSLWANTYFIAIPLPILLYFSGRTLWRDRTHHWVYLTAGLTIGLGFMFYSLGLIVGSVTKTTLLFYLTPVWSSILGIIFLGERSRPRLWFAHLLGLTGLALIMNLNHTGLDLAIEDIFGFLAGVFWSIGSVIIRRHPKADYLALNLSNYSFAVLIGLVGVLILGLPTPSLYAMAQALPVGFIASCLIFLPAMMLFFRVTQYVSPAVIGILMLSEVFFAALTASLFLGETLAALQWLGAAFIIMTAIIVTTSDDQNT
jgi:drug/metabolite transporter (DMT)-like permease